MGRTVMAGKTKTKPPPRSNDEIRGILLRYFYDRNKNATSKLGKKGVASKILEIRQALKSSHDLSQQEVWSNLTYLISMEWVREVRIEKSVPLRTGTVVPQTTTYYEITAVGIDKIEGPGEFTTDKFKGIKIEATGQNIITVGDGNQVNARYGDAASALADLKKAFLQSDKVNETQKLEVVADIDSIQSQLAKTEPNRSVIRTIWGGIRETATGAGLIANVAKIGELLGPFL
jgi:hypothetical protein